MSSKSLLAFACIALIAAPFEGRGGNVADEKVIIQQDVGDRPTPAMTITISPAHEMNMLNVEPCKCQMWTPPVSDAPPEPEVAPPPAAEPCDCKVDPRPGW